MTEALPAGASSPGARHPLWELSGTGTVRYSKRVLLGTAGGIAYRAGRE
jgi:hypothetical protein